MKSVAPALSRGRNRFGDDGKRQDEFERIVEERQSAEPFVPSSGSLILGVDGERDAAGFGGDGQSAFAGRKQQIAAKSAALQ